MEMEKVRQRWIDYNMNLVEKFANEKKPSRVLLDKLKFFAVEYLIDFESELEEDPDNRDGGIITLDTITAGYIDSYFGRWYVQKNEGITEKDMKDSLKAMQQFYEFLKEEKLYREKASQHTKLMKRLGNEKKYLKRLKEYRKIQKEKGDEEKYLDLMREWEFEDL